MLDEALNEVKDLGTKESVSTKSSKVEDAIPQKKEKMSLKELLAKKKG